MGAVEGGAEAVAGEAVALAPGRGDGTPVRMSIMRRAMARRMVEAVAVPCFYLRVTADVTDLLAARAAARAAGGPVPSVNDCIVRAAALELRAHPEVNATYDDGVLIVHPRVNVGVAIAVEGGLVVPAVYDADVRDAASISAAVKELVGLAGRRKLGRDVLSDATFTVSNLGSYGIEDFDPIINPPQAAILGVGTARPATGDRQTIRLTLGCDHRALTGAEGAVFLTALRDRLQTGAALLAPAGS